MNYLNLIAVFVAGGLGSVSRYVISRWVYVSYSSSFPYGTLLVNVISCFIMGLFIGYSSEKLLISPTMKIFITVGFCGGFSTFSAFAYETFELLRLGQYMMASANILGSMLSCIVSIVLGLIVSKFL